MQTKTKPWAAAAWAAVAVPGAGFAAVVVVDALRCGPSHAVFAAFFAAFVAGPLAALGLGLAALGVTFWPGEFPLRGWRIVCSLLAFAAVIAAPAFFLHDLQNPNFCRIEL